MAEYELFLRDAGLRKVAQIDDFADLSLLLRFNEVGGFELTLPPSSAAAQLVAGGAGLIVERDGLPLFSGPIRTRRRTWGDDADHLFVGGPCDNAVLRWRLASPVPAGPPYTDVAEDVRTGPAETVMRGYVDANLGPGAPRPERRFPGLALAPDLGRGASGTWRARFDPLIDKLREVALGGGDWGFRVVQASPSPALEFQVYPTADKTAAAIFSEELGNLGAYDYSLDAPEATYVVAAGGGEGAARTFVEGGDAARIVEWGRAEAFVDARDLAGSADQAAELALRRDTALAERREQSGLSIAPVDTAGLAFGADYGLGDRVTVVIDGVPVREVLREVRITLGEGGEAVRPALLTPGGVPPDTDPLFAALRNQAGRFSRLERR